MGFRGAGRGRECFAGRFVGTIADPPPEEAGAKARLILRDVPGGATRGEGCIVFAQSKSNCKVLGRVALNTILGVSELLLSELSSLVRLFYHTCCPEPRIVPGYGSLRCCSCMQLCMHSWVMRDGAGAKISFIFYFLHAHR